MIRQTIERVNVNGAEIEVADLRLFDVSLPRDWYPLPNSNWAYCVSNLDKFLQAAGHDPRKIDYAVPQDWWDEQYRLFKREPRACWSYESKKINGEPLYWSVVRTEFENALHKVWIASGPRV